MDRFPHAPLDTRPPPQRWINGKVQPPVEAPPVEVRPFPTHPRLATRPPAVRELPPLQERDDSSFTAMRRRVMAAGTLVFALLLTRFIAGFPPVRGPEHTRFRMWGYAILAFVSLSVAAGLLLAGGYTPFRAD